MSVPSLDGMQGGKALGRLCDTVLWLKYSDDKDVVIKTPCGKIEKQVNRIMHLIKTRSGVGQNSRVGFWFDNETLTFKEVGMIGKK